MDKNDILPAIIILGFFGTVILLIFNPIETIKVKTEYRDTCITEYEDSIYWNNLEYQEKLRDELLNFEK